jgi:NADH-quinone oxidoreductase subunit K
MTHALTAQMFGPEPSNMLMAYLGLGLALFVIGAVGVVMRRNPVVVFMCIELMLNAVNLTFLAFARYQPDQWTELRVFQREPMVQAAMPGQMMVIFVMAVAAAEVAVGLGIIMAIFRMRNEVDVDDMRSLKD